MIDAQPDVAMAHATADVALVHAAVDGDQPALSALLERYYPRLLRVCVDLTRDAALAQDCAQDACIVATLHLSQLRDTAVFGAWLIGIGRHTCQHALRARQTGPKEALASVGFDDGSDATLATVVHSDLSRTLRMAVADLPLGCRDAVRVFYLDGLGYAEAAARLGITLSALKVRLHEGRRILRHHFRLRDPVPLGLDRPRPRLLAAHEAGHAVMHLRSGGHVERISIAPLSAVWVGEVVGRAPGGGDMPLCLELQVRMAGEAATFLDGQRSSGLRGSGDRDAAAALALEASGGDSVEAALLVDAAWRAARAVLDESGTWPRVERIAAALLQARTIDGDDLRRLCFI